MFENLFRKNESPEEKTRKMLKNIKLAVVNQAYNISADFLVKPISNGLFALVVVDEGRQVRSLSRSDVAVREQEIFDTAINNTFKAGVDDRNDIITINNGVSSIEVIKFENNDYFLSSFILAEDFFHHIKKSPDVLFSCPSRDLLLVFPLKTRAKSNASDLILFGQFSFERYLQGTKKIRPDIYYWNDGAYGCLMKYDNDGNMLEIENRLLERICT